MAGTANIKFKDNESAFKFLECMAKHADLIKCLQSMNSSTKEEQGKGR